MSPGLGTISDIRHVRGCDGADPPAEGLGAPRRRGVHEPPAGGAALAGRQQVAAPVEEALPVLELAQLAGGGDLDVGIAAHPEPAASFQEADGREANLRDFALKTKVLGDTGVPCSSNRMGEEWTACFASGCCTNF